MRLAIVILNWNGKHLLQKFLPSVVKHSAEAVVYLADNASTDDSISFIKENYPTVKIINNSENFGFAKGYNVALKEVDADVLCLLNNDVEVTPNWLEPVINQFNKDKELAILQPKILDYKSKYQFEYAGAAGGFIDKYGYPFCRGRLFHSIEDDKGQYNDSRSIFWASGACFFIRKETYDQLDGFDESFFAHMEEIDLCWRAFNLEKLIKYEGKSTVYHVGGATLSETNPRKTYLNFRNSLMMLAKNMPKQKFRTTLLKRLILDGIAGFYFLINGKPRHTLAIFNAHMSFYGKIGQISRNRKGQEFKQNYHLIDSIVWAYYVNKKHLFSSL